MNRNAHAPAGTVVDRLHRHARERPDAPAIVAEGRTVTYREFQALVGGCADWLRTQGIEGGECVGVTIADDLTHIVVALGLASLGAAHVTLASHDPERARSRLAARVGARRVVAALASHRLPGLAFVPIGPGALATWAGRRAGPLRVPDASERLTFFSTSGTTGEAKIIPVTHGQIALQAARAHVGRALPLSSIEHGYAKRQFLYAVLEGATVASRGTLGTPVAHLCAALGIDVVTCMTMQAQELIADAARSGRLPAATVLRPSGSRGSAQFRRDLLAHVCDAIEVTYSMQECGSVACTTERSEAEATEAVGRPHAGVRVEIVDERGTPLPQGQVGEIRVRAPGMASGYLDDEHATARHFRDGWFHPGDLGSFTREGALIVHGRADDVMILNGIKIAPAEIERVLEQHPAVRAVAAFPLRSPVHGEVPVAAVELAEGARASEQELRTFARQALGLRAPRRVMIVTALPSNLQGKVDRQRLAEWGQSRNIRPGPVKPDPSLP
ncbi:fatty-acyl-CoA synthase [Burkholderiales bacterium]|nr:fatty-acyl-CoA synthase [Burkholderiales bacterium]